MLLCACVFGLNVWRAARQSITIDEAFTYIEYVSESWASVFFKMNEANNHILFSALARLSVLALGPSEFSLRLPSVLASILFLYCVTRLAFLLAPGRLMPMLFIGVVVLNPMTMDYMVAARGYSLALAFFSWALLEALLWLKDGQNSRALWIGVGSGLCVSANLAFVFPVLALLAMCSLVILWRGRRLPERAALSLGLVIMPAFAVPAAIVGPALSGAEARSFYWGARGVSDCVASLFAGMILHGRTESAPFGTSMLRSLEIYIILPAVFAAILFAAAVCIKRRREPQLLMITGILITLILGYAAAHVLFGFRYPLERTGLGLVFLFLTVWLASSAALMRRPRLRVPGFALCALTILLLVQMLTQIDPDFFGIWVSDWKIRDAMQAVRSGSGRISARWNYQPSVEFYRRVWGLHFAPVERIGGDLVPLSGYDYYFLQNPPPEQLSAHHLRPVFRDRISGLLVAVPDLKRP